MSRKSQEQPLTRRRASACVYTAGIEGMRKMRRELVRCRRSARGFSLIELGVALLIVALALGAIAVPLTTRVETRRVEDAERLLDLASEKLLAYAAKYGYLPCPATETSNGLEPPATNHQTGVCETYFGFLPAVTIGWAPLDSEGYALDPWAARANRIRYAVAADAIAGITNPFTRVSGLANVGYAAAGSATLLHICASGSGVNAGVNCGTATTLASNAAAVIWSLGPNARSGGTSIDEAENPNHNGGSADAVFVSRPRSASGPAAGANEAEYDDILRWLTAPVIARHLQLAGILTPSGSGEGGSGGGGGVYGGPDNPDD